MSLFGASSSPASSSMPATAPSILRFSSFSDSPFATSITPGFTFATGSGSFEGTAFSSSTPPEFSLSSSTPSIFQSPFGRQPSFALFGNSATAATTAASSSTVSLGFGAYSSSSSFGFPTVSTASSVPLSSTVPTKPFSVTVGASSSSSLVSSSLSNPTPVKSTTLSSSAPPSFSSQTTTSTSSIPVLGVDSSSATAVLTSSATSSPFPQNADPVPEEELAPSTGVDNETLNPAPAQNLPDFPEDVAFPDHPPSDSPLQTPVLEERLREMAEGEIESSCHGDAEPVPEIASPRLPKASASVPCSGDDDVQSSSMRVPFSSVVEGFRVRPDQAEVLRKIIEQYGDITASSFVTNLAVRSFLLGGVCDIVKEMSQKDIGSLKDEDLDHWTALLDELAIQGLKVDWLLGRLEELKSSKSASNLSLMSREYRNQLEELAILKADEARAAENLFRARADLEAATLQVEEAEENLATQQLKRQAAEENLRKIKMDLLPVKRATTILRRYQSGNITKDLL